MKNTRTVFRLAIITAIGFVIALSFASCIEQGYLRLTRLNNIWTRINSSKRRRLISASDTTTAAGEQWNMVFEREQAQPRKYQRNQKTRKGSFSATVSSS